MFRLLLPALFISFVGFCVRMLFKALSSSSEPQPRQGKDSSFTQYGRGSSAPEYEVPERLVEGRQLKAQILKNADQGSQQALEGKLDAVLVQIERQEGLIYRLEEALRHTDRDRLLRDEAEHRRKGSGLRGRSHLKLADQLSEQLEQLDGLEGQQESLGLEADRLVGQLRQLHLAVLGAGASTALLEAANVKNALNELERTTEELKQGARASAELHQLLG